jgi:hypothetical protein
VLVEVDRLASTISAMTLNGVNEEASSDDAVKTSPKVMDCIYVENDQYYGSEKQVSKSETPNWKFILKSLKSLSQRSEAYLEHLHGPKNSVQGTPVLGVNVPFWVLREFGTCLMRRGEPSASGAAMECTEQFPEHKKTLKTLAMAIDTTMKRNGYWTAVVSGGASSSGGASGGAGAMSSSNSSNSNNNSSNNNNSSSSSSSSNSGVKRGLLTMLLYSKSDDRFDVVSLGDIGSGGFGGASSGVGDGSSHQETVGRKQVSKGRTKHNSSD